MIQNIFIGVVSALIAAFLIYKLGWNGNVYQVKQQNEKFQGPNNGVRLFARNINNNGKIISEGKGATTIVVTENLEGSGEIINKATER